MEMYDFDLKQIPQELINIKRWGYAKIVMLPNGKLSKVPCDVSGKNIDHGDYLSKLIALLPLYKLAPPAVEEKDGGQFLDYAYGLSLGNKISRKKHGNGETGLLVLDYDHVCDGNGKFHDPAIEKNVEDFKRVGYVERSASGTGFHVFCWKPKIFDELKPPRKEDGSYDAVKAKLSNMCDPDGEQNYLEVFWDNRFILMTGKNEGQNNIVPADNPALISVVKTTLKNVNDKLAGTDAAEETPQENDVQDVAADPEKPIAKPSSKPTSKQTQSSQSSSQTPPKRNNKCAHKSGTVTRDPDKIETRKCNLIKGVCENDKDALYNDTSGAAGEASEQAQSVCNYIVNKSLNQVNADELNWIFTSSPFFKANYGMGKGHVWNDSKATLTYEKALNQTHDDAKKGAAGRPAKADIINGQPYENYSTQKGLSTYIKEKLSHLVMFDDRAKQWYIKDKDGFCFVPSGDNGYAIISGYIFKEIDKIDDPKLKEIASKFCTKANIQASIDLSKDVLAGTPTDIAYVFNGGKTLLITQDDDGLFHIDVRDSPKGLKTSFRVKGEYWEGKLSECPKDFQNWICGYGTPQFVDAVIRMESRALTCHPDKLCFQLTSDDGNTGKSTFEDGTGGAWGKECYTRIQAKEIMTSNNTGRRTAILQAIQKPFVVMNEAEGRINEGTYKEVIDTSDTFSGDYCGKDRVEVQRRGQVFIETNGLIRATNTSAYANRTYPIEFTVVFPMDDRIQAKIKSASWQKYARGIMINSLREYAKEFNAGKGIESQMADICPMLSTQRAALTQSQDFKQKVIMEVAELGTDSDMVTWAEAWNRVFDTFRGTRAEIEEWGMTKKDPIDPNKPQPPIVRDFNKTLKRMGFRPDRLKDSNRQNVWYIKRMKIRLD